jgi:predicted aspartyl protease
LELRQSASGAESRTNQQPLSYLPLRVQLREHEQEVECLLDTGFDGDVVLPTESLGGDDAPDAYLPWTLADGSEVLTLSYDAIVQIGQMPAFPVVVIILGSEPIVGRGVSDRFAVTLDHGARILVEP